MALTLEATLVIPVTMAITIGVLSASIRLYDRIAVDAGMESGSFLYSMDNKEIWSCKVNDVSSYGSKGPSWSKMISVNPVREKSLLNYILDTISEIKDIAPIFKEMEGLFFDDQK